MDSREVADGATGPPVAAEECCALSLVTEERKMLCLESACNLIAEARNLDEVKGIRDLASAAALLAKERSLSRQVALDALEIKLRAERRMGEMLREVVAPKGRPGKMYDDSTFISLADVGLSRNDSSRFQRLASIPEDAFEGHLADARKRECDRDLTTAALLRLARTLEQPGRTDEPLQADGCTVDDLHTLIRSGRKFSCIYADPPWRYGNQGTRAATDNHYPTMTVEEIAALPIADLAAENAHLHLWTTNGFLFDCPAIFEAWGFTYSSCLVWCKPQMGLGNYWRLSHEFMLLAIRGDLPFRDRSIRSWQEIPRGRHSAKPERIRELVQRVSPGPYLELFGRQAIGGWAVWGNQVSRDLFTLDIPKECE